MPHSADQSSSIMREEVPASVRDLVQRLTRSQEQNASTLNLVPSETRLSPLAQWPLTLDFYNRYFFNEDCDPGFWQFRGAENIGDLEETLVRATLSSLAQADYVNVRPISGLNAMTIAIAGLGGKPGSRVVTLAESSGGHYATAGVARRLGYEPHAVGVSRGVIDGEALVRVLDQGRVSLIYLDLQNSLYELEVSEIVELVKRHSPRTLIHVDCSHTLGLVLGGVHSNPLDLGLDSMGGSTHKSFPGPHKGILITRDGGLYDRLREAQFSLLSSHHYAETLSLGLAALEFTHFGPSYARQVVDNSRFFGQALRDCDFDVVSEGDHITDTHQVWVRGASDQQALQLSDSLAQGGVRVNIQRDLPGVPGSMLRLGTNEITLQGASEEGMSVLVEAFVAARDRDISRVASLRDTFTRALGRPYFYENLGL